MKLGEIRREALRLMYAGYEEQIETMTWGELQQHDAYAVYLAAIDMGINRAVAKIRAAGKMPCYSVTLKRNDGVREGGSVSFPLSCMDNVDEVIGVEVKENDWWAGTKFRLTMDRLYVPDEDPEWVVLYTKKWERVTALTPDSLVVPLPDELACLIPLWVKAELYEEENLSGAERAKKMFESALAETPCRSGNGYTNYCW